MSNDLSREENKRSTEVSGFLSGEEKKRSFALQAGRLAKVNQESFLLLVKGVDF
jgi:hypothetical protein